MSVVVAVIGILYFTVVPMYGSTIQRAKETTLKENLHVMRKVLDQYYKDHQTWPRDLSVLVQEGYVRAIPIDPITKSAETWVTVPSETGTGDVFDIHSGATGNSLDGQLFSSW